MKCRFCKNNVSHEFVNLLNSPPSNSYLSYEQLNEPEVYYPLKVLVCENCFLVQIDEYYKSTEIFNHEYAYFSSYSSSWLTHAKKYVEMMIDRFGYNSKSFVIEIASNDGYLLKNFKDKEIPVLGIEPTSNTAEAAKTNHNVDSEIDFFGINLAKRLAERGIKADLLLGNNVLAHVPDINDFVGGMPIILKNEGVITMEFPHLFQLIQNNQFDTIYHEHFSYLSFTTVLKIFENNQLEIFDVEELNTHGGSLRIFAKHKADLTKEINSSVNFLLKKEKENGMLNIEYYKNFQSKVNKIKIELLDFLIEQKKLGKKVVAYGAAAKGNTLLNYCGIKNDLVSFIVDANPNKQNKFMPGSHIPIVTEDSLKIEKPDFVIILPWNIKDEIISQIKYIREWNGKFISPIPEISFD